VTCSIHHLEHQEAFIHYFYSSNKAYTHSYRHYFYNIGKKIKKIKEEILAYVYQVFWLDVLKVKVYIQYSCTLATFKRLFLALY